MLEGKNLEEYKNYTARIRKGGPNSNEIRIPKEVGEVGDEVDVFVKITKKLVDPILLGGEENGTKS